MLKKIAFFLAILAITLLTYMSFCSFTASNSDTSDVPTATSNGENRTDVSENNVVDDNSAIPSDPLYTENVENNVIEDTLPELPTISVEHIDVTLNEYGLELPIDGATGYASINLPLYANRTKEDVSMVLNPGTAFTILEENEDLWLVYVDGIYGWIEHKYCFINLPDIAPSIIYDNTNSYSSMYRSVGNSLDGITNEQLYDTFVYNPRFDTQQFMMPVLYSMAPKICAAQNEALKSGNSLKLYEGFRPFDTQMKVYYALTDLMSKNTTVAQHVNNSTWSIGWFIATRVSNHQRGYAIDVSLVKVLGAEYKYCGSYPYVSITDYNEYAMPTPMHELSDLSCTFVSPVDSSSTELWKTAKLSSSMNDSAKLLQYYCTNSGLTPLSSEWWHFNDLSAKQSVGNKLSDGKFFITENCSQVPMSD